MIGANIWVEKIQIINLLEDGVKQKFALAALSDTYQVIWEGGRMEGDQRLKSQ